MENDQRGFKLLGNVSFFEDAEDLIVYAYRQKQKSINCTH